MIKHFLSIALMAMALQWGVAQPVLQLQTFVTGFNGPLDITHAGDARLFVVEQAGRIRIIGEGGTILPTPFLNITARVNSGANERGLLGLAFHPDYASNGYFYVNYTNTSGHSTISRFTVQAGNPNVADPNSELVMLVVNQPFSNHNGGGTKFGPDGYLYTVVGDGGSGGDPQNNGQTRTTLLGKMIRLDVDAPSPYVPASNPFVNDPSTRDEIWAIGLRNPWRFSFDRLTGDLWMGDVGQNAWEEINFQPASSTGGENYGWRCYEGNAPYNTSGCQGAANYVAPVQVYANTGSVGCSVTGGMVYRGSEFPNLQGHYLYADYCSGRIWSLFPNGSGGFTNRELMDGPNFQYSSFGEDVNGELYVTGLGNGIIYKVREQCNGFAVANTSTDQSCPGLNDGSILLTVQTNAATSTVIWSNGATGTSISNLSPGTYTATVTDAVGCRSELSITVNPSTVPPLGITRDGNLLMAEEGFSGYQWYLNNEPISGADAPALTAVQSGDYYARAIDAASGCTVQSETINVLVVGLEELGLASFAVSPNPTKDLLQVRAGSLAPDTYQVSFFNGQGQLLGQAKHWISADFQTTLDMSAQPAGLYFVSIGKSGKSFAVRVVKQ